MTGELSIVARAGLVAWALLLVAGCSDSNTSQHETSAAEELTVPDSQTTTGSVPPQQGDRDPTPQTTTGGEIPGGEEAGQ